MTNALADELGPRGIRVNALHPGPIETTMTTKDVLIIGSERGTAIESPRLSYPPQKLCRTNLFCGYEVFSLTQGLLGLLLFSGKGSGEGCLQQRF